MRRAIVALIVAVAVAGAAFAWVDHTEPAWWVRLRYPLILALLRLPVHRVPLVMQSVERHEYHRLRHA